MMYCMHTPSNTLVIYIIIWIVLYELVVSILARVVLASMHTSRTIGDITT